MDVTLSIPDAVITRVKAQIPSPTPDAVLVELRRKLLAFERFGPQDRALILSTAQRQALEALVQTTIADGDDLVAKVTKLATFTIGPVSRALTDGELQRLRMQAEFHGWTPEAFLTLTINELIDRLMERF